MKASTPIHTWRASRAMAMPEESARATASRNSPARTASDFTIDGDDDEADEDAELHARIELLQEAVAAGEIVGIERVGKRMGDAVGKPVEEAAAMPARVPAMADEGLLCHGRPRSRLRRGFRRTRARRISHDSPEKTRRMRPAPTTAERM